jgi:hypothetical protein
MERQSTWNGILGLFAYPSIRNDPSDSYNPFFPFEDFSSGEGGSELIFCEEGRERARDLISPVVLTDLRDGKDLSLEEVDGLV